MTRRNVPASAEEKRERAEAGERIWKKTGILFQAAAAVATLCVAYIAVRNINISYRVLEHQRRPWIGITYDSTVVLFGSCAQLTGMLSLTNYGQGAAISVEPGTWLSESPDCEWPDTVYEMKTTAPLIAPQRTKLFTFKSDSITKQSAVVYFHVLCRYRGAETEGTYYVEQVFLVKAQEAYARHERGEPLAVISEENCYVGHQEGKRVVSDR